MPVLVVGTTTSTHKVVRVRHRALSCHYAHMEAFRLGLASSVDPGTQRNHSSAGWSGSSVGEWESRGLRQMESEIVIYRETLSGKLQRVCNSYAGCWSPQGQKLLGSSVEQSPGVYHEVSDVSYWLFSV